MCFVRDKLLVFIISCILFLSWVNRVEAQSFSDVSEQHEFFNAVQLLKTKDIIKGYNNLFMPYDNVTRAHVSKMITNIQEEYRILPSTYTKEYIYFKDISVTDWYYPYVSKVALYQVMEGYPKEQLFKPNQKLTRAQATKVIVEALQIPLTLTQSSFRDVAVDSGYQKYISTLEPLKIIRGDKGRFKPNEPITRAQWAMMLERAIRWNESQNRLPMGQKVYQHPNLAAYEQFEKVQRQWEINQPKFQRTGFKVLPNYTTYQIGEVDPKYVDEALRAVQFVRHIADLSPIKKVVSAYNKEAQAASFLLALHDKGLTHYPQPYPKLSQDLYNQGLMGAQNSNIALGYPTIASSILFGYMMDEDIKNREDVGHRLWVLNPTLQHIGFGYAKSRTHRNFTAMKVINDRDDENEKVVSPPYIAWPTESAFPSNLFLPLNTQLSLPWSVSLSNKIYKKPIVADVQVRLTRLNDDKVFRFNSKSSHGFFTIKYNSDGIPGNTIIFQPANLQLLKGDNVFQVDIQGLELHSGEKSSIQFETTIFDLKN